MAKRRDWSKIGEMVREIRSRGMRLSQGAAEFGVPVSVLYEYNRVSKQRDLVSETAGSAGCAGQEEDPLNHGCLQATASIEEVRDRLLTPGSSGMP